MCFEKSEETTIHGKKLTISEKKVKKKLIFETFLTECTIDIVRQGAYNEIVFPGRPLRAFRTRTRGAAASSGIIAVWLLCSEGKVEQLLRTGF